MPTPHVETIGIIGEEPRFYGYVVGLSLERGDLPGSPEVPARMFARFETGSKISIAEVPDHELFSQLASHLCSNAQMRNEHGDYGYSKVWIEKKDGQWHVDLP